MTTVKQPTELVVVEDEPRTILHADPSEATAAFANYRAIQASLDAAMPDCVMHIQGKVFRKKSYWRAIATAFSLDLELVEEKHTEMEGGDDWGFLVTYRATAPNGRAMLGDGACFLSEKRGAMRSVHNVRSHAHTRAKNRAISDLVGFGEVSAEEVDRAPSRKPAKAKPAPEPVEDAASEEQKQELSNLAYIQAEKIEETLGTYAGRENVHALANAIKRTALETLGMEGKGLVLRTTHAVPLGAAIKRISVRDDGATLYATDDGGPF